MLPEGAVAVAVEPVGDEQGLVEKEYWGSRGTKGGEGEFINERTGGGGWRNSVLNGRR